MTSRSGNHDGGNSAAGDSSSDVKQNDSDEAPRPNLTALVQHCLVHRIITDAQVPSGLCERHPARVEG
jgi:hypothetical protein